MGDLRERLIAAKLAGTKTEGGYTFRSNEAAAEAALVVVAAWLRDEATNTKNLANSAESLTGRTVLIVRRGDSIITGDTDVHRCTGLAARWCPVHGDCICPPGDYSDLNDETCPLHAAVSDHGERVSDG